METDFSPFVRLNYKRLNDLPIRKMREFHSHIVKRKLSLFSIFLLITTIVAFIGMLLKYIIQIESRHWIFDWNFGIMLFFSFLMTFIKDRFKGTEDYKILDILLITEEYIKIGEMNIPLNEVSNLRFDYNGTPGEGSRIRHYSDGGQNELIFKWKNKAYRYTFLTINFKQKKEFIALLESLYKKEYSFIENHYYFGRTYLLEKLRYKQIQSLKRNKY